MDFGDYCAIEMKRYGVPNEFYIHKVIGRLESNGYVDVPVQSPAREVLHTEIVPVVACVCCGVGEREILRYRECDVAPQKNKEAQTQQTTGKGAPCPVCGAPWNMSKCNACSCGAVLKQD